MERGHASRGRAWFAALLAAAAMLAAAPPARPQDTLEAPLKATFLYRFGDFITWPETAFADPSAPLDICVIGADTFGDVLDRAVAGQQAGGRTLAVHRFATLNAFAPCHIAFITGSPSQSVGQALASVRGAPVLTVTDAAAGASAHGMMHFEVVDNRVRFHVDENAAADSGLVVSSRLLGVALTVRRRGE